VNTFVFAIDPNTGDLALDDGLPVAAPSAAIGLAVFTLRTPLGECPVDPTLGVNWKLARTATVGVELALARELERALRWVEEGGYLAKLKATAAAAGNRLAWAVSFEAEGSAVTLRGAL
jgi:hypothetical protein